MRTRTQPLAAFVFLLVVGSCMGGTARAERHQPGQVQPEPVPLKGEAVEPIRGATMAPSALGAISAASPGLGWETTLLQGTTDFLVDRARGELSTLLITRLGRGLCKADSGHDLSEARSLVIQTCQLIDRYHDNPSNFFGPLLTSAIREDLELLPVRLLPDNQAYLVDTVWTIAKKIRQGQPAMQLLAGLSEEPGLAHDCATVQKGPDRLRRLSCAIPLTGAIIRQLTLVADEPAYQQFLQNDDKRQKVISALITLINTYMHDQILGEAYKPMDPANEALARKLFLFIEQARHLHERVTGTEQQVAFSSDSKEIFSYRSTPFSSASSAELLQRARLVLLGVLDLLRSGQDIFQFVATPNLSAPADKKILLAMSEEAQLALRMAETITDVMVGSYDEGIRKALDLVAQCHLPECTLPPQMVKYLPLFVSLSEAKTRADVQQAIESAAAPIGSWALKRQRTLFTLTGLIGAQGALELGGHGLPPGAGVGPMGVLGLELTTPLGKGWDFGAMVSGLDLGQLVYPRVTSSDTSKIVENSNPTVFQVLSPGLYLRFGVPDMPLTLGAGGSLAPQLRCDLTSATECTPENRVGVFRVGIFAAVDVTVLNFSD